MKKLLVFISYSRLDQQAAETLHARLESAGYRVWRDTTRLKPGETWSQEIAHGVAASDVICLIWSKNSALSKWVKHEWLTGRALEKIIVPCLLSHSPELPQPLSNLQSAAFSAEDEFRDRSTTGVAPDILLRGLDEIGESRGRYDFDVLPANSYIPFNPDPNFTGRHLDLLSLYLKMIGNLSKIGINQVGTVGMGGIGKTQLAVEFAYRFSFAFGAVYWIPAENQKLWLEEFVSLARDRLRLQLDEKIDEEKEKRDRRYLWKLQEFFKRGSADAYPTLIVMDNVEYPAMLNSERSLLRGLTPLTLGCNLLFTTRRTFALPGVLSQPVDVLSQDAAYQLLTNERTPDTPREKRSALAICNAIGHLPLALVLAGKYLARYRNVCSFVDYHAVLVENKLVTIDIGEIRPEELATRHVAAVGLTLKQQWAVLASDDARRIFELAGVFPEATIIPKDTLGIFAGISIEQNDLVFPLEKAILTLHELNLMEVLEQGHSVRLHPLVRDFAVRLISVEEQQTLRRLAVVNLKAWSSRSSQNSQGDSHRMDKRERDQQRAHLRFARILARDRDTIDELYLVDKMMDSYFEPEVSMGKAFDLLVSLRKSKEARGNPLLAPLSWDRGSESEEQQ
jgi:TIR domain/NB-ARC domain